MNARCYVAIDDKAMYLKREARYACVYVCEYCNHCCDDGDGPVRSPWALYQPRMRPGHDYFRPFSYKGFCPFRSGLRNLPAIAVTKEQLHEPIMLCSRRIRQ